MQASYNVHLIDFCDSSADSFVINLLRNGYCWLNIRFVMKTDDDAFVNMFSLIPRLHELATRTSPPPSSSSNMLLLCNVWHKVPVEHVGKYNVERTAWPYDYWPTFCQGFAYMMTMNFVKSAREIVPRVPHLRLEDVSQTGYRAYTLRWYVTGKLFVPNEGFLTDISGFTLSSTISDNHPTGQ